ncbi:MAG TPA: type II secretion system F family protein [Mycobacteriales bacterium]|jgi:tight adherence protein B|nr:type II secretion system F family protein [Mycobacteriales bacterium]
MIEFLAALLVLGGISAAVIARVSSNRRTVKDLRAALEMQALSSPRPEDAERTSSLLARSGLAAEKAFADVHYLDRVRHLLDRSDWSLTAGEFAVTSLAAAGFAAIIGFFLAGPVLALIFAAIAAAIPYVLVVRSVRKRKLAFEEQFPEVLDLIAASLESGASVVRALELVVEESDEPTASEFGRVLVATRMGTDLSDALATMSERLGSRDVDWTVQAISVQQRTGGKLADILRIVARTMRGRGELLREVATLTVEGRMSAIILGALPFFIAVVMLIVSPQYLKPLFHETVGLVMVGAAGALMLVGFVWMSRIIRVEV